MRISLFIFLLLLAAGTVALLYSFRASLGRTELREITVADAQQPVFSLLYVADRLGYFRDEGLSVQYRKFSVGKDALADVVEGNSDVATVYEIPVVHQILAGNDVRILSGLHTSVRNTGLVGRRDHGVSDAVTLRGKRIAMPFGTNTEFFLDVLLTTELLSRSQVELIDMPADLALDALVRGDIDAAVIYNPYLLYAQQQLGENAFVLYTDAYSESSVIAGTEFVREENRERITRFLRALVRAQEFARENPETVIAIADEWLPLYDGFTIRATNDSYTLTTHLSHQLITILTREARFYIEAGVFSGPLPDMRTHIASAFLREVNPEYVTID